MKVEFATFKPTVFITDDYVKIDDGKWLGYDELDKNTLRSIFLTLTEFAPMRKYLNQLIEKHIVDKNNMLDQVQHIAHRFFPKCDRTPDIDDKGNINIEVQ